MSGQMSGHVCVFDVFWYMLTVIITILPNILESFKHRCRAYIPIRPAEISPAIDSFTVFQYVHIMVMKVLLLCVCLCVCVCVCV